MTESNPVTHPAPAAPAHHPTRTLIAFTVGATAVLIVMLTAFTLPIVKGGPNQVPVGVAGPAQALAPLANALGGAQWEVSEVATEDDLIASIRDRDLMGGFVLAADGLHVYIATAAGQSAAAAISALGNGLATQQGGTAEVTDLVAFPAEDPRGAGFAAAALPMVIGGVLPAILLLRLFPGHAGLRTRLTGAILFSAVAGASVAAYLTHVTGTLDSNYWLAAAGLALGMAALSLTFIGLESLFGMPGLGLGAAIVVLLGNPLSGMATGPHWLPTGWATLGQLLPPGASGSLLRANAFFTGTGAARPALTLTAWVLLGLVLILVADRRGPRPPGATS